MKRNFPKAEKLAVSFTAGSPVPEQCPAHSRAPEILCMSEQVHSLSLLPVLLEFSLSSGQIYVLHSKGLLISPVSDSWLPTSPRCRPTGRGHEGHACRARAHGLGGGAGGADRPSTAVHPSEPVLNSGIRCQRQAPDAAGSRLPCPPPHPLPSALCPPPAQPQHVWPPWGVSEAPLPVPSPWKFRQLARSPAGVSLAPPLTAL